MNQEDILEAHGWTKCFSKTHQREYYFNTIDGTQSWDMPVLESEGKKNSPENSTETGKRTHVVDEEQIGMMFTRNRESFI